MSEFKTNEKIFDQINSLETLHQEVERKLVPLQPEQFEPYKQLAVPIEQVYLSQPGEDYTLRVRATYLPSGEQYMATLKNKGVMTPYGLSRLEVETPISRETYSRYARDLQLPRVKKLRTTLASGVTIDWIDGVELPLIEIEDSENLQSAVDFYEDYKATLIDVTGDPSFDNSALAYEQYGLTPDLMPELDRCSSCERNDRTPTNR